MLAPEKHHRYLRSMASRHRKARPDGDEWATRKNRDRPTPERRKRGAWALLDTEDAGVRVARDFQAHPIDRLEHSGQISNVQASAGRDFEKLVRAATEVPGARDSCVLWEPKGYESDDGNVHAVQARKEIYLSLGMVRDKMLRRVCVDHVEPRLNEVGILRECLNEAARFFRY